MISRSSLFLGTSRLRRWTVSFTGTINMLLNIPVSTVQKDNAESLLSNIPNGTSQLACLKKAYRESYL